MKKKLFLFISLVLLAVQGWTSPVDPLILSSGNDHPNRWNGVDKVNLVDFLGSVNNHNYFIGQSSHPVIELILEILTNGPIVYLRPVDENETFDDVVVGATATKTFEVVCPMSEEFGTLLEEGEYHLASLNIKWNLLEAGVNQEQGIYAPWSKEADMFSVSPASLPLSHINGKRITITYKPTAAGVHGFTIVHTYDLKFLNLIDAPDWFDYFFVLPTPVSVPFYGTAVAPTLTISESSLEFGNVLKGETRSKSFTVNGRLASDLTLSLPWASNYKVSTNTITPEEAANGTTVTVTYTPSAVGIHNDKLYISGGGVENIPPIDLSGECVAKQTITVTPSTWDFGTVNKGEVVPKDFLIEGTDLNDQISVISTWDEGFEVSNDPLPATGGTVTVTFKPTCAGDYSFTFYVGNSEVESIPITVTGKCVEPPKIITDKSTLDFGTVYKGKTANPQKFTVTGVNLTGDLTLTSNRPWFTVNPSKITAAEAAEGKEVTVTYNPTAAGDHNAILTISGGDAEEKTVSLTGKCAAIEISSTSHDFGTHKEGDVVTETFTVTGTNLSDRISIVSALDEGFTISPSMDVGLPSTGGKVTVTFTPTSGGNYSRTFTFSCGDAFAKLTVTGKCAAVTTNKSALYFGTLPKSQTKTLDFTVTGINVTHDLTLTSSNSTIFEVNPTTITAAEAKAGKKVTVTYKPTVCNDHNGTVTISGQDIKNKTVSLSGKCANITVSPTSYDFGTRTKGQTYTTTFTVTGTNVGERISVVSQYEEGFTITPTDLPAAGGEVTVTFTPTSAGSSYSHSFKVSGGGITSSDISVTGKCGTPYITVSPTSLSFTSASSSKTITVKGYYLTGSLTLTCSGAPFAVTTKTITAAQAAAASGVSVTVQCNAPSVLQQPTTGSITISGGGASSKTVTLSYNPSGSEPSEINSVEPEDGGDECDNEEFTNGGSIDLMNGFTTDVNELALNSRIYAEGLNVIIESPVEQSAVISDISGRAMTINLKVGRNEIPVNASGVFIVRIREKTAKLMLK